MNSSTKIFLALTLALFLVFGCTQQQPQPKPLAKYNAGYKLIEFEYTKPDGTKKMLATAIWYPTSDAQKNYNYSTGKDESKILGGQSIGLAAINGKIAQGKFPLIVFSHGYTGCGIQSIFLTEEMARNGYIVVAPDHEDALCSSKVGGKRQLETFDLGIFGKPETWDDSTFGSRPFDIKALLDEMQRQNKAGDLGFGGKIDEAKTGIMGHSLGGYTTLALSGANDSWKDSRIKAAVAFAPYTQPFLLHDTIRNIRVPVMIQGGTKDSTITPFLNDAYKELGGQKFLLILSDTGHMQWANISCVLHASAQDCMEKNQKINAIGYYTTAFFDKYIKASPDAAKKLETKKP
ncbi:MAG: hypothetical protein AABW85_02940, partial [archaeon]